MSSSYPPEYPGSNEPTPYPAPPPPPPSYGAPMPAPGYAPVGVPSQGSSGLAIASLVLGIVGLCTGIAGIAAVICGHMALNQIKQSNNMIQGRGLAIAGLVLGYLEIAGMVAWVLLFVVSMAFTVPVSQ